MPVVIANAIAWPLAWYYLHGWLQGFAYRIALSPLYFIAIGFVALLIAWVAAFVAFLVAPLIVLGIAWLIGLTVLAIRHRTPASRGTAPATAGAGAPSQAHRFGGAGRAGDDA